MAPKVNRYLVLSRSLARTTARRAGPAARLSLSRRIAAPTSATGQGVPQVLGQASALRTSDYVVSPVPTRASSPSATALKVRARCRLVAGRGALGLRGRTVAAPIRFYQRFISRRPARCKYLPT